MDGQSEVLDNDEFKTTKPMGEDEQDSIICESESAAWEPIGVCLMLLSSENHFHFLISGKCIHSIR